jgi:hypothetical protein
MINEQFDYETIPIPPTEPIKSFEDVKIIYSVIKKKENFNQINDDKVMITIDNMSYEVEKLNMDDLQKLNFQDKFKMSDRFAGNIYFDYINITQKDSSKYLVDVKLFGTVDKGFVILAVVDSDKNEYWKADPKSFDNLAQMGKLKLEQGFFETQWTCEIPVGFKNRSDYYVLVYEDTKGSYATRSKVAGIKLKPVHN